jgi:signal transduction histidine kinase
VGLGDGEEYGSGVAVDLSKSGFQFAGNFPVVPGTLVPVTLHLTNHKPVQAIAEVVWCQEMELGLFRTGFQFEELSSQKDFERLCSYIEKELLNAEGLPTSGRSTLELSTQVTLRTMSQPELDRFAVLAKISDMLNSSGSLSELLDRALKIVVEATGAERGLMILDCGGPKFEVPLIYSTSTNESRAFSHNVVEKVRTSRQPLLSLDAQRDERFSGSSSLRMMGTRSVLCVPIETRHHRYGILYLDNSVRAGALNQTDLKLASILSATAASAIERTEEFEQLVQSEKLATIGTLTACFLHELSNPLTSILGIGELLHAERGGDLTRLLIQESQRCDRLVGDLLRLARREPNLVEEVDLKTTIDAAASAVISELSHNNVRLELFLPNELPMVNGNADQLRQVVLNLLSNAIHAAAKAAHGLVEVRASVSDNSLSLFVTDNGSGIEAQDLSKIFDPFFTTKGKGEGTGLGLSIVARIVRDHGGKVRAENRASGGSLFQVTLPLSPNDQGQVQARTDRKMA